MFTASSQRIKSSMTGGRLEAGISSQIPEKYKQRNMRWTDLVHFIDRNGDLGRDLQFSSVLYIRVLHFLWHLKTYVSTYSTVLSFTTKAADLLNEFLLQKDAFWDGKYDGKYHNEITLNHL